MMTAPWYIAGPLLGLLIVGLRAAVNKPFGVLGGYIDVAEHAATPRRLGLGAFVLLGVVIGGVMYAVASGTFVPTLAYANDGILPVAGGSQVIVLLLAGVAMGFGALTAGGCTSGHGLTGRSLGSRASIVATATFFTIAVGLAHLLVRL